MIDTTPTFGERMRDHASRIPDVAALESDGVRVAYGALPGEVSALARAMTAHGIRGGEVVALMIRDEIDHLLATMALFELGIVSVALTAHEPQAMRARLMHRVGVTSVLADDPAVAVDGVRGIEFAAVRAAARAARAGRALPAADPDAPALVLTGSGTTGEPKLVRFSQRDVGLQAARTLDFAGQRALRSAHVAYNNSKRIRLYTLWQGGTCVLVNGSQRSMHWLCANHRITRFEGSPMHARDLVTASRDEGRLPEETAVRIGGSRMPWALRSAFIEQVTPRLHVSYGTTETSIVSLAGPAMHDPRESVGTLFGNASIGIVGPDGAPVAPGDIGEIRIRVPGMATGYVGDPAATARHFRDGWFVPGDLASQGHDGMLHLHGRIDDMMIMNGINIFPTEIERVLEAHPSVEAAAAFPIASRVHGQIPIAAVELRAGCECTAAELLGHARDQLGLRAPRRVEILAALPRNAQGKVVRREIAGSFGDAFGA